MLLGIGFVSGFLVVVVAASARLFMPPDAMRDILHQTSGALTSKQASPLLAMYWHEQYSLLLLKTIDALSQSAKLPRWEVLARTTSL